jgi:protein gp37
MFKRRRFSVEIILLCVRWYCKYGISYVGGESGAYAPEWVRNIRDQAEKQGSSFFFKQ